MKSITIEFMVPWQHYPGGQVITTEFIGWARELVRRGVAKQIEEAPVSGTPEAPDEVEGVPTLPRRGRRKYLA